MNGRPIERTYLPFTPDQLRTHFASTSEHGANEVADRQLPYYLESARRYQEFMADHPDRRALPISTLRLPCQIEKDERFWTVTCLMDYYYSSERPARLSALLRRAFGNVPPLEDIQTWEECFAGRLYLFFEVSLPSPSGYKRLLRKNLRERQFIPYVVDAGFDQAKNTVRLGLEGPTHVDAMLLNADNGFAILFEAKVLSDISYQVTFDATRNQIARNIDVMLESNPSLPEPLSIREPKRTLFVMLTPKVFRRSPHSRLYGWLINEYYNSPDALARDIPHRKSERWPDIARRVGWLTWEDSQDVLPGSCPWLERPRPSHTSGGSGTADAETSQEKK